MSIELKIKIKHLAEEARIIRKEEKKAKERRDYPTLDKLHHHRIFVVRRAARETQLAYAFLRGRDYLTTEKCKRDNRPTPYSSTRKEVERLVKKYGELESETVSGCLSNWIGY